MLTIHSALSLVSAVPGVGEQPLSNWPMLLTFPVPKPRPIDPDVMSALKWSEFVGYAPNHGYHKRYSRPLSSSSGGARSLYTQ